MLSLATADEGDCLKVIVSVGERARELGCNGDRTDACCRKARGFPPMNTPVVAIGTYAESIDLGDGRRMDSLEVESTCLPAPAPKAKP